MKIKSISLEAFRAYEKEQKFDFTTKSGNLADLVVIFGPNGFGKTSFTDAIEWAFTGDIGRISQNEKIKDTIGNEKKNADGRFYILKNRKSLEPQGKMITITDDNKRIEIKTKKLDGRMTTDYFYDDISKNRIYEDGEEILKDITSEEFKTSNIITSDTINSFLQFDNPHERYKILTKFWDGNAENELYIRINSIYKEIQNRIASKEKEISGKDKRIKKLMKNKINYEKINELVCEFNSTSEVKLIGVDEENYHVFKRDCDSISDKINIEKKKKLEEQKEYELLVVNYNKYLSLINNNNALTDERNKNRKIIISFQSLEELKKRYEDIDDKLKKSILYKKGIDVVIKNRSTYINLLNKNELFEGRKKIILKDKDMLLGLEKSNIQKILDLSEKLHQIQLNEKEFDSVFSNFNIYVKEKNNLELKIRWIQEYRNRASERLDRYKEKINHYSKNNKEMEIYLDISQRSLNSEVFLTNPQNYLLTIFYKDVKIVFDKYRLLLKERDLLYSNILLLNDIEKKRQNLLKLGISLVKEKNMRFCPLCNNEFKNNEKLIQHIENNDFMKSEISLNADKSNINLIKLEEVEKEFLKASDIFKLEVERIIQSNNEVISRLVRNKNTLENDIRGVRFKENSIKQNIERIDNIFYEIKNKLNLEKQDISYNEIKTIIQLKINQLRIDINQIEKEIDIKQKNITENKQKMLLHDNELESISNSISQNFNNDIFLKVKDTLNEFGLNSKRESIVCDMIKINSDIHKLRNKEKDIDENIEKEKLQCNGFDKTSIIKRNSEIDEVIKNNINFIVYQKSCYDRLIANDEDIIDLENLLNHKTKVDDTIDKLSKKEDLLGKIKINYNLFEQNSEKIELLEEKKLLMEKKLQFERKANDVKDIKENIEKLLKSKIQQAFNINTINYIYKRIDPHPEFHELKFVPEFTDNKNPKMFIHALNDKDELPPVLYFSAAQVSILSLSIFLAKALLNNNKIDTIFMDDPVQHLDSINILSFIDLIRTIIVEKKFNKQVVITTNNESFYRLLKLKLNDNYYDSRFIELKSYGVVKQ